MTSILGLAGKKQSGKSSLCDFLARNTHELFHGAPVHVTGFAETLKRTVSELFTVPLDILNGTDDDKNRLTNTTWRGERLTARRLMQVFGTDMVRALHTDAWVNATMARVAKQDGVTLLADVRFPNEVEAIQRAGGKVVRLTRNGDCADGHESEKALDRENFDWRKFDAVIENDKLTLTEQNMELYWRLRDWGWVQ